MERILNIPAQTWGVLIAAAPWLLFGLVLAGVIRAWLPDKLVARWLGGKGIGSVVRAAIIGTPLPLCSCGVVPTAIGLRRQGASKPATVSFLVATPENGADSIAMTYALMGPVMAIARPVAALISAIAAGALALSLTRGTPDEPPASDDSEHAACAHADHRESAHKSCCAHESAPHADAECCHTDADPADQAHDCCAHDHAPSKPAGAMARLRDGIRYAFTTLLDDLAPWLAVGLVLAGALAALIPPDAMAQWGRGPLAMLVMAVIGVPIYVCATAFTPVGASLLLAGVSPGAVLVLLLAGPATNLGTIGIVKREMGWPVLVAYLVGVMGVAIACGLALDAIVSAADISIEDQAHMHEVVPHAIAAGAGILLIVIAIRPLRRMIASILFPGGRSADSQPACHATEHHG